MGKVYYINYLNKKKVNERKIKSIIDAYKILKTQYVDTLLIDCLNSESLEKAIERAATARDFNSKKHSHQNLIQNSTLSKFADAILDKIDQIRTVKSFDDLISMVQSCKVKGIGPLAIYDTAQRIGCYLEIYPDKIYLHSGTRTGAEILLGPIKGNYIMPNQLPQPFQIKDLSASEIEDILCIYKDRLSTCV